MTNIMWRLVDALALQLAPVEREAVLGDLIETQTSAGRSICEIGGLLVRRQLQLWKSFEPWLAAAGLAFPCSLMLMGFSFAISSELRDHFVPGTNLSHSLAAPAEAVTALSQIFVLLICSWTIGFTVDSLSRRSFVVSAVCCFLPCLFCLLRFHHQSLPRLCLFLFLPPAIAGIRFSRRTGAIKRRWAVTLAGAATISLAVLAAHGNVWILNWVLVGPAWYLVVRPGGVTPAPENEGAIL
ncbi:MAG TPA: hypothetical protein VJV22_17295 [Acidobacteriaceae bacterium]|nr:hypothetical protein [Acidobacteriaceae bacterium]